MRVVMIALSLGIGAMPALAAPEQPCVWTAGAAGCAAAPWPVLTPDGVQGRAALRDAQAAFLAGDFAASAAASARAVQQDPRPLEAALWHVAAMARLGRYPGALLATLARDGTGLEAWPGPLLAWFTGRLDRVAVQDLATDQNSAAVEHYTFSFFYFHVASLELAAGRFRAADEALAALLDLGDGADADLVRAASAERERIALLRAAAP